MALPNEEDDFADAEEDFSDLGDGDSGNQSFPLQRAAYYNDAARIKELAAFLSTEELQEQDPHGNNALHVAALRRATAAAQALLDAGLPVDLKSSRGWTALEESLAARDHTTAKVLHAATLAAVRQDMKAKRRELLRAMRAMPDYTMNLSWRLGSAVPGLGMLLRRYAPADTYTMWKVGDRLRVDGSLMGIDTKSAALIPEWKRGHFSLIMDGSNCNADSCDGAAPDAPQGAAGGQPGESSEDGAGGTSAPQASNDAPRLLFLHHSKQRWVDLGADKKAMKSEAQAALEDELLASLERDVDKQRFKARGFQFAPLKGWLGGEVREKVEGWQCRVYEAAGKMVGVSTSKAAWDLPDGATFDDYLALQPRDDAVSEVVFNPLDPTTYDPLGGHHGRNRRGGSSDGSDGDGDDDNEDAFAGDGWGILGDDGGGGEDRGGEGRAATGKGTWWGSGAGTSSSGGGAATSGKGKARSSGSWWGSSSGANPSGSDVGDSSEQVSENGWLPGKRIVEGKAAGTSVPDKEEVHDGRPGPSGLGRGLHSNSSSTLRVPAAELFQQGQRHGGPGGDGAGGSKQKKKKSKDKGKGAKKPSGDGRVLRARLWMAEGFPMRLSALVPLLGVIGSANKQISKVARFMSQYAGLDLFPVKIQVPLLLTVHALVGFSKFQELGPVDTPGPEFFQVPEDYSRRLLNDMIDKHTGGMLSGSGNGRRYSGDSEMFGGLEDELDWT